MKYVSVLLLFCCVAFKDLAQNLPITPSRTISFRTTEGSYMNVNVSPDGRSIVFDLLGDLYSIPEKGGNATQLTRGLALNMRPVWSPDGSRIAYLSDRYRKRVTIMLVISTGIIMYSGMYRSDEATFLLTTPVRPQRIFLHKFLQGMF